MNRLVSTAKANWFKLFSFCLILCLCLPLNAQELSKEAEKRKKLSPANIEQMSKERLEAIKKDKSINSEMATDQIKNNEPSTGGPLTANCEDLVIGVKFDFAIFYKRWNPKDKDSFNNSKADCKCVMLKDPDLKGCADMAGKKLIKVENVKTEDGFYLAHLPTKPNVNTDDPRVKNNPTRMKILTDQSVVVRAISLTGKTNCRLFSENNKYIIANEEKSKPQNSILPEQDISISSDGDQGAARWDFVPVDEEDPNAGFFIVTRETVQRTILRNGSELQLYKFANMDGKARENSKWAYFIAGLDEDGNTRYMLHPADDVTKAIAVDERTGVLSLKAFKIKKDLHKVSMVSNPNRHFFWNVECIF